MTVVKQSPFCLVSKLGYVRNYAVSMMCFPLLPVCPEVSCSCKHNHFLSTTLEQEQDSGALRVCLFISVSDFFSDTFSQSMRIKLGLASAVLLLILYVFSFST